MEYVIPEIFSLWKFEQNRKSMLKKSVLNSSESKHFTYLLKKVGRKFYRNSSCYKERVNSTEQNEIFAISRMSTCSLYCS